MFRCLNFKKTPSLMKLKLSNEMSLKVLGNQLVMGNVLKYLEVFDIQSLRKTCHGIRSCVDYLKPDPQIENYAIHMGTDKSFTAYIEIPGYGNSKAIPYKKTKDCKNIVSRIFADFEMNLKNQKTCLECLELLFDDEIGSEPSELLTGFKKILMNRTQFLKVKKLHLFSVNGEDVMKILPYLDPKSLEVLEITNPYYGNPRVFEPLSVPFDIEEMAKTEQWKFLEELNLKTANISIPIQNMNLTHFSTIYMSLAARITSEDIAYLKENLLTPKLRRFIICFKEFVEDPQLTDLIGQPRAISGNKRIWYFPIPGTNGKMMEILLNERLRFENVNYYRYS